MSTKRDWWYTGDGAIDLSEVVGIQKESDDDHHNVTVIWKSGGTSMIRADWVELADALGADELNDQ